ncbi:MAG TPA: VCBS repeat-containing protein [Terriglobales bacterium]|nr:VCBS repeat-containing protein [Terriglobales bacterium]
MAVLGCILLLLAVAIPTSRVWAQPPQVMKTWTQSSYLDFAEGTLTDGGANDYVGADGSVRLINQWDLNGDGNIDIVLPSQHDNNLAVPSYVYWNDSKFDVKHRTELPADGGSGGTITDLNNDGIPDVVIANSFNGTRTELQSFIYWGSTEGYSSKNRTGLPTVDATAVAAADLNGDGHVDLVFASGGSSYQFNRQGGDQTFLRPYSDIYWGSGSGFSSKHTSALPTFNAGDVKIADLNHDGYPDILFAMRGEAGKNCGVFIYWASKQGYSEANRTYLPGVGTAAVAVADLNGDGLPDVLLANEGPTRSGFPVTSYIYWGTRLGYSVMNRTELPTQGARDVKVGDLNGDGFPDIVFANREGGASFIYWGQAGLRGGYSPSRRSAIPTLRASHCAIFDLNHDGFPDLIFSNEDDGGTKNISSYVYWNSKQGFDVGRRLELPTLGAMDVQVTKLNEHRTGLVFINSMDGVAGGTTDTYVYWGSARGLYSASSRFTVPLVNASSYTIADLNADGYPDLLLCASGGVHIFWGSKTGLSLMNSTVLPGTDPFNASVADFNHDGYLDVAVSNWSADGPAALEVFWGGPQGFSASNKWATPFAGIRCNLAADLNGDGYPDILVTGVKEKAVIFWNGPQGFSDSRTTTLPTKEAIAAAVADLNGDGYLDIVIPNLYDYDKLVYSKGPTDLAAPTQTAPFEANTYIYFGGPRGYSPQNRQILPTVGGEDAAIGDLNHDGFLDLAVTSYHAGITRDHPSYIFWGSAKGFTGANATLLPTQSASLVEIGDYNHDGWKDILFVNHTSSADHRTNSYLYWGGKEGLSPERKLLLPSIGVHGLTRANIGNIQDRRDGFDYVSAPFCSSDEAEFQQIEWRMEPASSRGARFQVRFAATRETLTRADWVGPNAARAYFSDSPAELTSPRGTRCAQYKATLTTNGGTQSPVLKSVTLTYQGP